MLNFLARLFGRREAAATQTKYALGKVFTPGQPADLAFVRRTVQERDLRRSLGAPGTQILIWGESGAGKSSIALKVLAEQNRRRIITRCTILDDYASILASAFAQTRATMADKTSTHDTATMTAGTKFGGGTPFEASAEGSWESGSAKDYVPVVQTQVSAESLAEILGRQKCIWVIEDLHKVKEETRSEIADLMKVFSDSSFESPDTAVIVLGASDTASDILRAPSNMHGRLVTIELPPLDREELASILKTGGDLLRVNFDAIQEQILTSSVGIAGITHGLAFEVCSAMGIEETSETEVFADQKAFDTAIDNYVRTRSGGMKGDFDTAMIVKQKRTYSNHAIILKALAQLDAEGATHADIFAQIRLEHPAYPRGNLTQYLRELQQEDRRALIRKTAEGKFRYAAPLQYAYAIRRFNVTPLSAPLPWSRGVSVPEADQRSAAALTEESAEE